MESERLRASHYDGVTAVRHIVEVALNGDSLVIDGASVPLSALRPSGDRSSAAFAHKEQQGWRLTFEEPLPPEWVARLPRQEHYGGILDRIGVLPALALGAGLAAALYLGLSASTRFAARLVPERWEIAFGERLMRDFDGTSCFAAAGQGALDGLATRLSSDGKPLTVRVVDNGLVNAAAFPGRQIVLFRGLIDEAKSPDEIAGVLAHEIGHVEQRHVMAALIRDFGISLVLGGADGGAIAQGLLASRYSRSSESEADEYSMQALTAAHISAEPTAAFFERMGKEESKLGRAAVALSYVASHPLSEERRQRFRAAARQQKDTAPALDREQWRALKGICAEQKRSSR